LATGGVGRRIACLGVKGRREAIKLLGVGLEGRRQVLCRRGALALVPIGLGGIPTPLVAWA
jgi:hypothetical protein